MLNPLIFHEIPSKTHPNSILSKFVIDENLMILNVLKLQATVSVKRVNMVWWI